MTTTDFSLPILFPVTGIPRRGKHRDHRLQFVMVDVAVPTVSPADAPVAATWAETNRNPKFKDEGGIVTIRHFDGRFLTKPLSEYHDARFAATERALRGFLEGRRHDFDGMEIDALRHVFGTAHDAVARALFEGKAAHNPILPFKEGNWASIENTAEMEEKRDAIQTHYEGLVLIDGEFWQTTPEPVYTLKYRPRGFDNYPPYVTTDILPATAEVLAHPDIVFNLADWDLMVQESETRHRLTPSDEGRAEIHLPTAFTVRSEGEVVKKALLAASNHDGDMLKTMSKTDMGLWADMRDAIAEARTGGFTDATLEAALQTALRYIHESKGASQHAMMLIEKAERAWDGRRVDVPLSFAAAKPR